MPRRSKGRQRVEMAKMTNESNLQVTFSKRRFGLFKKANELVTLCGAEVGLIIFSPGHKVYTFGHPHVETVIDKFINRSYHPAPAFSAADRLFEAHRMATIRELNNEIARGEELLEEEKRYGEILEERLNSSSIKKWWDSWADDPNMEMLKQFKNGLEDLKKDAEDDAQRLTIQGTNPSPYPLDSGLFGRNFSPYMAGFNMEASTSTMPALNLRASGAAGSTSASTFTSLGLGIDLGGYGRRFL